MLAGTHFPLRKRPLKNFSQFSYFYWAKMITKMISNQLGMTFILKTENSILKCKLGPGFHSENFLSALKINFMPNWLEIIFVMILAQKKVRKSRENFATVFFGAETGSQLTFQKLVFGFKDKLHAQLIGNHFCDDFS